MIKLNSEIVKLNKNQIVLDAGIGDGKLLYYLTERTKKVYGIDYNKENIKKIKIKRKNLELHHRDIIKLGYTNKFDVIFCLEVLEHIPNPNFAIRNLYTALMHNGICVISVPTNFSEKIYGTINKNYNRNNGEHISIFTKKEW